MPSLDVLIGAAIMFATLGALAALALRIGAGQRIDIDLVEKIDALLPQTQCGQCGHPGCRPYAQAIALGEPFNRCPPGREHTVAALAELLHEPLVPLDIATQSDGEPPPKAVAFIREAECIGCTKCIQACPVDAILGATKLMHTVIADECTGCDLCVAPCPVDCIEMRPLPLEQQRITPDQAAHYKARFVARNLRLVRDSSEHEMRRVLRKQAVKTKPVESATPINSAAASTHTKAISDANIAAPIESKQAQIQAAIARAKAKKAAGNNDGTSS